jgi:hypothetical protein
MTKPKAMQYVSLEEATIWSPIPQSNPRFLRKFPEQYARVPTRVANKLIAVWHKYREVCSEINAYKEAHND